MRIFAAIIQQKDTKHHNNMKTIGCLQLSDDGKTLVNCTDKNVTTVVIPSSVTKIGDWAFDGCTSLTAVEIPSSVTEIGWGAFCRCTSLTMVEIPNSVTKIGNCAFLHCSSLASVEIPGSVTEIGKKAFRKCNSLKQIIVDKDGADEKFRGKLGGAIQKMVHI